MALFKAKTEEEKAAEVAAGEAARQEKSEQQAAMEQERKRKEFEKSPAGQARAAKEAGRRYFQVVTDVTSARASATWEGNVLREQQNDQSEFIAAVEDEGWTLHDVGYVFQETGSDSKSKAIGSGERTAVSGKIVGVYLFRTTHLQTT